MNFIDRVMGWLGYSRVAGATSSKRDSPTLLQETNIAAYFRLLWAYYENNALYDATTVALRNFDTGGERVLSLRNPAHGVVEFYAATVCPGTLEAALPVVATRDTVAAAIRQIWGWSNWAENKQVAVRQFAAYGNVFIKISQRTDGSPYMQIIRPDTITAIEQDERGNLIYARIDTPIANGTGTLTRTEIWAREEMRMWVHALGDASEAQLGTPTERVATADLGIDFVPIVHGRFLSTGGTYGANAYVHALDKIDMLNRYAWRLGRMLFGSKSVWAILANSTDRDGRPLPAVSLKSPDGKSDLNIADAERDLMIRLPGASDLKSVVPPLPYADVLAVVEATEQALERDLPEMRYWRVIESATSGAEVERRLAPAISRAREARGNFEAVLIRAHMMALTIGAKANIFKGIGTFENGDFEHSFKERAILPSDALDIAQLVAARATAGQLPHLQRWRELGFSDEQITQLSAEREAELEQSARMLLTDQIVGVR